jgi:hypothetical protein
MKVQKILHIRIRPDGPYSDPLMNGGATVILDGNTENMEVQLRVAFCNPIDVFCKKSGRVTAETASIDVVQLRTLPGILGKLQKEVYRRSHVPLTP